MSEAVIVHQVSPQIVNDLVRAQGFRVRRMAMSLQLLELWFQTGNRLNGITVVEGIPLDAQIVGITYNPFSKMLSFAVFSAQFEPVAEGESIPDMQIVFRQDHTDWKSQ